MTVYDDQNTNETVAPGQLADLEQNFADPSTETPDSGINDAIDTPTSTESGYQESEEDDAKKPDTPSDASDRVGTKGYTGSGNNDKDKGTNKRRVRFSRRKAIIGGGLIGTIFGIYGTIGVLSGPLEFIHFAQSLHIPHFSRTENLTDSRLGKLYVYSRTGSAGDTRLNWLQRKHKNKIVSDLKSAGIEPITDTKLNSVGIDNLKDWQISLKEGEFAGMTPDDVKAWAKSNGIDPSKVKVLGNWETSGRVYISARSFGDQLKSTYTVSKLVGESKISAAARTRILTKFFNTTFHPMKPIDNKINLKLAELYKSWKTARETRIKQGATAIEVRVSQETVDEKSGGKSVASEKSVSTKSGVRSSVGEFLKSPAGKITGGALMGAGFVCAAHEAAIKIDGFKQAQVIAPLIRIGTELDSLGSQVPDGTDVDTTVLDFYAQQFVTRDKNGKILNSWSDAMSLRANNGQTGGINISSDVRDSVTAGVPPALSWALSPPVNAMCSNIGMGLQTVAGVATIALSGGIASGITGAIAWGVGTSKAIDYTAGALSGESVKIGTGAELGGQADYGMALAANAMGLQFAGSKLSQTQKLALDQQSNEYEGDRSKNQSIASRLFDASNRHSFIAKVIDSHILDARNNFAILKEQGMLAPMRGFGSLVSNMFAAKRALASTAYDYGFSTYGVSLEDQNNPLVAVPQANAKAVADILDQQKASGNEVYVSRALKCYGIKISKGSQGWGMLPQKEDALKSFEAAQSADKWPAECDTSSSEDPNWLRVRFFIIDTATMEGWACLAGDEESCALDGFTDSNTDSGGASAVPAAGTAFGADGFISGQCVAYVQHILEKHLPGYRSASYGNGKDFAATMGKALGYTVNHTPAPHAVVSFPAWRPYTSQGAGHVAMVVAVNSDGSILVEESNWGTVGHYGTHTVPANLVSGLTYAHVEGDLK